MARDKYALEGPESTIGKQIGAVMAAAMSQRTAGRGNIVEAPGARLAAGEASMADDAMWREKIQNIHSMQTRQEQDAMLAQRAASMADASGRGLQLPYDWGTAQTGAIQSEEDALMAQMAADFERQQQANVSVDTAGTPGGFTVTGDNPYVQNLPQQDQFPKAFAGQGSPQFGGTELGMVPEGRRTEQGFSAQDYTTGGAEALGKDMGDAVAVDTVARNALKWVNDLFRGESEEQQKGAEAGQKKGGVTATGLGPQDPAVQGQSVGSEMTPEEAREVQQHQRNLEETRPGNDAAATVSWPTTGGDTGNRTRDLNLGVLDRIQTEGLGDTGGSNADEIIGSLLQKYGSQLKMAGYGEQVEKFASGNYTKADIDGLIGQFGSYLPKDIMAQLKQVSDSMVEGAGVVVEELAGLDPNYSRFQGTTSSGSSHYGMARDAQGNPLGFQAKDYNPEVGRTQADKYGRLQEEDFMDYTKRMHKMRYPDQ